MKSDVKFSSSWELFRYFSPVRSVSNPGTVSGAIIRNARGGNCNPDNNGESRRLPITSWDTTATPARRSVLLWENLQMGRHISPCIALNWWFRCFLMLINVLRGWWIQVRPTHLRWRPTYVHTQTFTCADFGKSSDHLMIDFGNLSRFLLCEAVNLNNQSTNIRASGAWCFLLTLLLSQWLICLYWTVSVHNLTPSDTRTLPFVIKRLPVFFFILVNSLLSWRLNAPPLPSQQINTVLLNQIFFLLFMGVSLIF